MKQYIDPQKNIPFKDKSKKIQKLINVAIYILDLFGIPTDLTPRRLERMAIVFLATGDIKSLSDFKNAKDINDNFSLKTRDIINFVNEYFEESISSGSYDDIRRKDLKYLVIAGIVLNSNPNSATNDSTRGYSINPLYAELLRNYGEKNWADDIKKELLNIKPLTKILKRERNLEKINVEMPSGIKIELSIGQHNELQKKIIEEFLPRYGYEAEILYLGDTSNKYLYIDKNKLKQLDFFEISHEELPDIIAYSNQRNWLYLIEAVDSSGPISELRLIQLQKITQKCTAEIIYVSAFLDKSKFRKFIVDIAWETEVWIADNPDHLIHFNGDKFLGPYKK